MSAKSSTLNTRNDKQSSDTEDRDTAIRIGEVITAFDAYQKAYARYRARLTELPADIAERISQGLDAGAFRLSRSNGPGAVSNGAASHAEESRRPRLEQMYYAKVVLRGCQKGMHYRDITIQALKLGLKYKRQSYSDGPIPEDVIRKSAHSLNGAMNKCDDIENLGNGFFKLEEKSGQ